MKLICEVLRSTKKEGAYLYLDKLRGLKDVPEVLMEIFGKPEPALTFIFEPGRPLANVDSDTVRQALLDQGYYLQMPKLEEDYMSEIAQLNSKLPR